jgi:nitrate reductase / nitrite oxidoreductase, beta subunit
VLEAASTANETDLYEAQLGVMLDPNDPDVIAGARRSGISDEWVDAARRSPIYALAKTYRIALPLHPEYRTMPMVWYVPPLSPVVDAISRDGHDGEDPENLFGAIDALRIPIEYLAGLFSAGDTAVVTGVLKKLAAMRAYMRDINLGREPRAEIPASVGMSEELMYEMYRLLAIAKYDARYVIPTAYATEGHRLEETATECSLDFEGGPGMYTTGSGPFGESSGQPMPMAVESFQALKERQTSEDVGVGAARTSRVNLLNWDGKGSPETMFAPRPGSPRIPSAGDER